MHARGRALCGPDGTAERLLGAAFDTTGERAGAARVTRVLEAMPAGFYCLDREWRFTHVNAEAERLLGRTREELLGRVLWDEWPAALNSIFEDSYRTAVRTGLPVSFDAYYPAPLDGWYELRAWPSPDGLSVYFLEVTERRRVQEQAERSARAPRDPGPGQRRARRHAGRPDRRPRTCPGSSSRRWPTTASSPWSTPTGGRGTSAPGTPTPRAGRCCDRYAAVRLEAMPADLPGGPRPDQRRGGPGGRRRPSSRC